MIDVKDGTASRARSRRWIAAFLVAIALVAAGPSTSAVQPPKRLTPDGTAWRDKNGARFEWKGITAFRLVEFVAHGREAEADRYLQWAATQHLTIVRVLAMGKVLFPLPPNEGLAALDRFLDLAERHGIAVEIVALADTASYDVDLPAHVARVGEIAARHANTVIEIANEPYHPTQSAAVHRHDVLRDLRTRIPREVAVSLGTLDEDGGELAAGDYVTWHSPRVDTWAERMTDGLALIQRFKKPVVADEPMGAADRAVPGRRDSDPSRFGRAAAILRGAGVGGTFHYEGGLQARVPTDTEAACLRAWMAGLSGTPAGR
jgi:hypothetical protein